MIKVQPSVAFYLQDDCRYFIGNTIILGCSVLRIKLYNFNLITIQRMTRHSMYEIKSSRKAKHRTFEKQKTENN